MSLIDIPKHVLHENIFKNLDWNSRINFNLSLHPRLRMGIRLNKTQIEIHEMYAITTHLTYRFSVFRELLPNDRIILLLKTFKLCKRPRFLNFILGTSLFRAAFIEKLNNFQSVESIMKDDPTLDLKLVKQLVTTSLIMKYYIKSKEDFPQNDIRKLAPICVI